MSIGVGVGNAIAVWGVGGKGRADAGVMGTGGRARTLGVIGGTVAVAGCGTVGVGGTRGRTAGDGRGRGVRAVTGVGVGTMGGGRGRAGISSVKPDSVESVVATDDFLDSAIEDKVSSSNAGPMGIGGSARTMLSTFGGGAAGAGGIVIDFVEGVSSSAIMANPAAAP